MTCGAGSPTVGTTGGVGSVLGCPGVGNGLEEPTRLTDVAAAGVG